MKKVLFLIILSLATLCCVGNDTAKDISKTPVNENPVQAKVIHITLDDFRKKIANLDENTTEWKYLGDKPAIIDFYADWCGPCKKIAPVLDELAKEYSGEIYIYKVDTDKESKLASMFGITSIPSLLFIPMEGEPQMARGALPKETLKKGIDEVLLLKK